MHTSIVIKLVRPKTRIFQLCPAPHQLLAETLAVAGRQR